MFWIEFAVVLLCIFVGARVGGVALGTIAGLGLMLLVFGLRQPAGALPVDVLLIIIAVVTAASALQAAGGLDWMVSIAERLLQARPQSITFVAPAVSWLFTFLAGTGHVAYALLPVISETARKAGIRPERPLSISVIASQQSITASPISAATAGMIALLAVNDAGLGLADILLVCIPATLFGSMIGALVVSRLGRDLSEDPAYLERVARGDFDASAESTTRSKEEPKTQASLGARLSVFLFIAAAIGVVGLGLFESWRPVVGWKTTVSTESVRLVDGEPYAFAIQLDDRTITRQRIQASLARQKGWVDVKGIDENTGILNLSTAEDAERLRRDDTSGLAQRVAAGEITVRAPSATRVDMARTIQIVMLAAAGLMMLFCAARSTDMINGSVARAGVVAVVSILGIAWLGSTFFQNNSALVVETLSDTVRSAPWTFSIALFALSILLYSQAATVAALMGVGLQLGIEPKYLIAMFPAVNGYFFLPTYATLLAAIQFDQTGTTRIGRYVLNHSFMIPGLVATASSIAIGFLIAATLL